MRQNALDQESATYGPQAISSPWSFWMWRHDGFHDMWQQGALLVGCSCVVGGIGGSGQVLVLVYLRSELGHSGPPLENISTLCFRPFLYPTHL